MKRAQKISTEEKKKDSDISLPMIRSKSLMNMKNHILKHTYTNLKNDQNELQRKGQHTEISDSPFLDSEAKGNKKIVVSLQIHQKNSINEDLTNLKHMIRQKKLENTYNTVDLWKSKYSLQLKKQTQLVNSKRTRAEPNEFVGSKVSPIKNSKYSKILLQIDALSKGKAQLSQNPKKIKKVLKHSPNTNNIKDSLILLPAQVQTHISEKKKDEVQVPKQKQKKRKKRVKDIVYGQQKTQLCEQKRIINEQDLTPTKWDIGKEFDQQQAFFKPYKEATFHRYL